MASFLTLVVSIVTNERNRRAEDQRRQDDRAHEDQRRLEDRAREERAARRDRFSDERRQAYGSVLAASSSAIGVLRHAHDEARRGLPTGTVDLDTLNEAVSNLELLAGDDHREAVGAVRLTAMAYWISIVTWGLAGQDIEPEEDFREERAAERLQLCLDSRRALLVAARSDLGISEP